MNLRSFNYLLIAYSSLINTSQAFTNGTFIGSFDDVLSVHEDARSGTIKKKQQVEVLKRKRSDKGDLPVINNDNSYQDMGRRRIFYVFGDGNCFFHAIDESVTLPNGQRRHFTRQDAVQLFLRNSRDSFLRQICSEEIFDMFMASLTPDEDPQIGLPEQMTRDPEYQNLRELLLQVRMNRASLTPAQRRNSLDMEDDIKAQIKENYCRAESTFRSYVEYVIGNPKKYMMAPQNILEGWQSTYFIDGLAYLLRKTLRIWNYHSEGNNLVKVHEYSPHNALGTWELVQSGEHFNRAVPAYEQIALERAQKDEEEHLKRYEEFLARKASTDVLETFRTLKLAECKALSGALHVSALDQVARQREAGELEKQLPKDAQSPDNKKKTAYYKAQISVYKKKAQEFQDQIQTSGEPNLLPIPKNAPAGQRRFLERENQKRREKFEEEQQAKVPALRSEIDHLQKKISYLEPLLRDLHQEPTEIEVLNALFLICEYYGQLEAEAKKIADDASKTDEQRDDASRLAEIHHNDKKLFGDCFDNLAETLYKSPEFQINTRKEAAQRRLQHLRAQNLTANGSGLSFNYTQDHDAALRVIRTHYASYRGQSGLCFNPEHFSENPFVGAGVPDVNATYPDDISAEEWNNLSLQLSRSVLECLVPDAYHRQINAFFYPSGLPRKSDEDVESLMGNELTKDDLETALTQIQGVFSSISGDGVDPTASKSARKRFKRVIDTMLAQTPPDTPHRERIAYARAAVTLAQNAGRCLDGVCSGLDIIENQLFSVSRHLEDAIGSLFSNWVHLFYQKFSKLYREYDRASDVEYNWRASTNEWKTNAPQIAKARTFLALSQQGSPRTNYVYVQGDIVTHGNTLFSPTNLMQKFLQGGSIHFNGKTISFEAFTGQKLVDLLYQAYLLGLSRGNATQVITKDQVIDFINKDPELSEALEKFNEGLQRSVPVSDLFGVEPNSRIVAFKPKLFERILVKLGCLIDKANINLDKITTDTTQPNTVSQSYTSNTYQTSTSYSWDRPSYQSSYTAPSIDWSSYNAPSIDWSSVYTPFSYSTPQVTTYSAPQVVKGKKGKRVKVKKVKTKKVKAKKVKTRKVKTRKVKTKKVKTRKVKTKKVKTRKVKTKRVKAKKVKTRKVKTRKVKVRKVKVKKTKSRARGRQTAAAA